MALARADSRTICPKHLRARSSSRAAGVLALVQRVVQPTTYDVVSGKLRQRRRDGPSDVYEDDSGCLVVVAACLLARSLRYSNAIADGSAIADADDTHTHAHLCGRNGPEQTVTRR